MIGAGAAPVHVEDGVGVPLPRLEGARQLQAVLAFSGGAEAHGPPADRNMKQQMQPVSMYINSTAAGHYPSTATHLGLAWPPSPARYGLRTSQPGRR